MKLKTKTEKRRNMNDTITEINKDTFWGLIREARDSCGQDMSAMV